MFVSCALVIVRVFAFLEQGRDLVSWCREWRYRETMQNIHEVTQTLTPELFHTSICLVFPDMSDAVPGRHSLKAQQHDSPDAEQR